ncbi:pilus assembly protein TadG-related protein [Streptomyces xanthophaeus]|uniref:pilus assembly protein TadG-related protein n=1 Tax=Streptomyces xanthophaeus TaxID=67385 RepID=UPI00372455D5
MTEDRGQAFPIYIVVVAGLLFAALAFFAFGQAAIVRSNAQKAADAAALAAARDARDTLLVGFNPAEFKETDWKDLLDGRLFDPTMGCASATTFAEANGAEVTCVANLPRFTVTATTTRTVGSSVVPGVSDRKGSATAAAVIRPRCQLSLPDEGNEVPPDEGKTTAIDFTCAGADPIHLDPLHPPTWATLARSLFSVSLVS